MKPLEIGELYYATCEPLLVLQMEECWHFSDWELYLLVKVVVARAAIDNFSSGGSDVTKAGKYNEKNMEMRGIEPRAFHMRSERSTTELHPLPAD